MQRLRLHGGGFMGNTDGNLYALNQYLKEQEWQDMRDDAIEDKTNEIREELLSVSHKYDESFVIDADNNKIELSDFIADMDINDGIFAEYLTSGGNHLKDKLNDQLDVFCKDIATGLIDNRG